MRLHVLTTVAILAIALPAAAAAPFDAGAQPAVSAVPPELAPVLERAGRYALEYERDFPNVGADEEYTQWTRPGGTGPLVNAVEGAVPAEVPALSCYAATTPEERGGIAVLPWCSRSTKAEAVLVRSPGGGLRSLRDVHQVEGVKVRDADRRLERLFASLPAAEAERQGRGLLQASDARYSIGPCMRDLNAPTLALVLLNPVNQPRFAWKQVGRRRVENVDTVEVALQEVARPTLLRQSDGEPLPVNGRLWIDAVRGTLVRGELEFRFAPRWARALVTVDYRLEPALGTWVPAETREQYEDLPGGQPMFGRPTKATAKFSGFHRLDPAAAPAAVAPPPYGPELVQALQRAGEYVAEYERSFSDLLVEEAYAQETVAPVRAKIDERGRAVVSACSNCRRKTRAELVFVRLAGEVPWASYRDVFEVDGRKLREPDQRLVKLLSTPHPDPREQAKQLLAASAAYNIGPVKRTVNLPTLPLVFLVRENQPRFEFRLGERRTIAATEVVELEFRETSRPTLTRGPNGADLPAKGRFWLSPTRGTVVRSEVELDFGPEAEARVTTDYRPEPTLAMWVPSEMREEYADVKGAQTRTFSNPFTGVARYSRFRRFSVSSQETAVAPSSPQ